jgi:hypothetical protein
MPAYEFRLRRIPGILVRGSGRLPAFLALAGAIAKQDEPVAGFICKMGFRQYFEPANPHIP